MISKKAANAFGLGDFGENLSIMIPNYNGAKYIGETIASLKAQSDRICGAQIEVLDNYSTDDSEKIVYNTWGDKVKFFRHPTNIGGIENFNACIAHAERRWIHILHSDDFMLPGSYQEFGRCAEKEGIAAIYARCIFADQDSLWAGITPLLGSDKQGCFRSNSRIWRSNPLQYAGILVSREAYKSAGDFDLSLPFVCDWDMWWRISQTQSVYYTNACAGAYRMHSGSSSAKMQRTGTNINQSIKLISKIQQASINASEPFTSTKEMYEMMFAMAIQQAAGYLEEPEAFVSNMKAIRNFPATVQKRGQIMKLHSRYWKRKTQTIVRKLISKRS